jgi:hypothetical protein
MGFLCTEIFKNTLGVSINCFMLLFASPQQQWVGCLSLEPWCDVAHGALGCSDVYGMLQRWWLVFVVCVLTLWNLITKCLNKECYFGNLLYHYLFPLYSFCIVFVYWGSSILQKGCCFSIILTTQLNFSIF